MFKNNKKKNDCSLIAIFQFNLHEKQPHIVGGCGRVPKRMCLKIFFNFNDAFKFY